MCKTRKFVLATLHWKQGLLCDKTGSIICIYHLCHLLVIYLTKFRATQKSLLNLIFPLCNNVYLKLLLATLDKYLAPMFFFSDLDMAEKSVTVIVRISTPARPRYVYSVAVHQKYLKRLGELIIFEPWLENYHFLPTELDIFDKRQHYIRIIFIFQRLIC